MKHIFSCFRFSLVIWFISLIASLTLFSCIKEKDYTYSTNAGLKPTASNPWLPSQPYTYATGDNNYVTLGRVLFYDKNLSLDRSVSCGSCHKQENGFADNKPFSTGYNGLHTTRNAHSIVNTDNSKFWDGRSSSYSDAALVPLQSHVELNMTDLDLLSQRLSALPYYQYLSKNMYNCNGMMNASLITEALSAFMNNITASNTRYDQSFSSNGQVSATLSPQELNGLAIFNGKGKCSSCHNPDKGFGGSTNQFEDIGLDASYTDLGRGAITGIVSDQGKFQVPSLKNVALTAPYMHDGRFNTLNEVVDFFSENVKHSPNLSNVLMTPLMLSSSEKSDLVSFLNTLTDNSLVNDVRFSDPFKH